MAVALRWGIVGTGWIAERQVADLQLDGHEVVAVGSRSVESARRFAERFGLPKAHGSYADLVADPDVDLVYVATPNNRHAEDALLAIGAGKPVMLEKPFALNAAEARRVLDAAAASGVPVMEAMWTRFLPQYTRIRDMLASGALGRVGRVLADNGQRLPADPSHRINDPELGGGALLDLGIYPVSLAWMVLGAPSRTLSTARLGPTGVDRAAAILVDYPGGGQAVLATSADDAGPNRASIIGEAGRIDIAPVFYGVRAAFTHVGADGAIIERWEQRPPGRGMQFQAREFERLVSAGERESPVIPHAETIAIMEHLDLIRRQIGVRYSADL